MRDRKDLDHAMFQGASPPGNNGWVTGLQYAPKQTFGNALRPGPPLDGRAMSTNDSTQSQPQHSYSGGAFEQVKIVVKSDEEHAKLGPKRPGTTPSCLPKQPSYKTRLCSLAPQIVRSINCLASPRPRCSTPEVARLDAGDSSDPPPLDLSAVAIAAAGVLLLTLAIKDGLLQGLPRAIAAERLAARGSRCFSSSLVASFRRRGRRSSCASSPTASARWCGH
jgi:hypothetical protein